MSNLLEEVSKEYLKTEIVDFRAGDRLRVAVRIVEGDKERIQQFEGLCIARRGAGLNATFTVRRTSHGVSMERIFPLHSPRVESITVLRHGHARRSKLYYLRDLTGKKARLPETHRKRLERGTMVAVPGALAPEAAAAPEPEAPAAEAAASKPEAPAEAPAEAAAEEKSE